jgi:hypothetical protein
MRDARHDDELGDIMALTETRRGLFRRSLLGLTGLGVAGVLVACGGGDDEGDDDEPVTSGQGAEDPGEEPGIGEETGIGADGEDEGTEEAVSEEEGAEDEDDGD